MSARAIVQPGRAVRIVDGSGESVAVRIEGDWVDPFGGTFTAAEVESFDALVDEILEARIARAGM